MKSNLIVAFLCLSLVAWVRGQSLGDSMASVETALGKPSSRMVQGDREVWLYAQGKVVFRDGRVVEATAKKSEKSTSVGALPVIHKLPSVKLSVAIPGEFVFEDATNFGGKSGLTFSTKDDSQFELLTVLGLDISDALFAAVYSSLIRSNKEEKLANYQLGGWDCYQKVMKYDDGREVKLNQCFKRISGAGICVSLVTRTSNGVLPTKGFTDDYLRPILQSIK